MRVTLFFSKIKRNGEPANRRVYFCMVFNNKEIIPFFNFNDIDLQMSINNILVGEITKQKQIVQYFS